MSTRIEFRPYKHAGEYFGSCDRQACSVWEHWSEPDAGAEWHSEGTGDVLCDDLADANAAIDSLLADQFWAGPSEVRIVEVDADGSTGEELARYDVMIPGCTGNQFDAPGIYDVEPAG